MWNRLFCIIKRNVMELCSEFFSLSHILWLLCVIFVKVYNGRISQWIFHQWGKEGNTFFLFQRVEKDLSYTFQIQNPYINTANSGCSVHGFPKQKTRTHPLNGFHWDDWYTCVLIKSYLRSLIYVRCSCSSSM